MRHLSVSLWVIIPLLPLLAGFTILALLDHPVTGLGAHLPGDAAFFESDRQLRFFNVMLPNLAIATLHFAACCAVLVLASLRILALDAAARRLALTLFAATLALLVAVGLVTRTDGGSGALNLGYRYVCMVLSEAGVARHVVPASCTGGGLSRFAWFALFPLVAGLMAASLANSYVGARFSQDLSGDRAAELRARGQTLEETFKCTALLMATSTLALLVFYRLPLALIKTKELVTLWTGYAQAMTLFWGVLFTLTIASVFGHASLRLKAAVEVERLSDPALDIAPSFLPPVLKQRMVALLSTLAPLLIGAAGPLVEAVTSLM